MSNAQQRRYVFATFCRYAMSMSDTQPVSTSVHEITITFVTRLTWDSLSGTWRILLKPVNGEEVRHFSDVESALLYLESLMTDQLRHVHG